MRQRIPIKSLILFECILNIKIISCIHRKKYIENEKCNLKLRKNTSFLDFHWHFPPNLIMNPFLKKEIQSVDGIDSYKRLRY